MVSVVQSDRAPVAPHTSARFFVKLFKELFVCGALDFFLAIFLIIWRPGHQDLVCGLDLIPAATTWHNGFLSLERETTTLSRLT